MLYHDLKRNPHDATLGAAIKLGEAEEAQAQAQPADTFFMSQEQQHTHPSSALDSIIVAGPCSCCRCFTHCCVSCACCALQTIVGQKGRDPPEVWAHRVDLATGLYYGSILLVVMGSVLISLIFGSDDGFSEPADFFGMGVLFVGRLGLEPAIVMLELGIIVSLTYDHGACCAA